MLPHVAHGRLQQLYNKIQSGPFLEHYALTRRSIDAAPRPRWSIQISSMGSSDLPPLSDRPSAKQFWMTQVTRDSSRNFLGAEAVAVDLVNSDLVADNSLSGIQ